MINPDDIRYMTSEDYLAQVSEITASIRDELNDIELLTKLFINDKYYTSTEIAEMLHCTVQQIPRDIPCAHIGRLYLYRKSDVEKYLSGKRTVRKA